MQPNSKRYLESYELWNGSIMDQLKECETKGEIKSRKERIIKDIKGNYYPKVCEKQIIQYVRGF